MKNTTVNGIKDSKRSYIKVKIERGRSLSKEYTFKNSFTIGRSEDCSIQLNEAGVSRNHVEVILEDGKWWIVDKQSSNGTFLNGNKIDRVEIKNAVSIELGNNGPILLFTLEETEEPVINTPQKDPSVTGYIRHYFDESGGESEIGEHTKLMREAFKVVKKKHTSKYIRIIIAIGAAAVLIGIYAIYQQIQTNKQKALAENIFYDMKSLELDISTLRKQLSNSGNQTNINTLDKFDARHQQLEKNYEKLVDDLGIYNLDEKDKLIIKCARIFGECELAMPKAFMIEVKDYIKKWQSSGRLINDLERARQKGYIPTIIEYLQRNQLPSQFFYLALQESDFKEQIIGPATRYGYAKGMWQFIAETAKKYDLKIGPLANLNVFDPEDDRFNFPKATSAAARYIKDIYTTDAQASGLLVMASYNWGENNIITLIRSLPENPRERNFWKLLEKYRDKIPGETYNYVFYIFSAAVIGENPRLFGFNFDNPLKNPIQKFKNP
jgi:membrane-bound lytic murein transglycosylase D